MLCWISTFVQTCCYWMRSVLLTKRLAFSLKYISNSQDLDTAVLFSASVSLKSFPLSVLPGAWSTVGTLAAVKVNPFQNPTNCCPQWGMPHITLFTGDTSMFVCFKCTYNTLNSLSNRICTVFYRLGGAQVSLWVHGSCCVSRHPLSGSLPLRVALVRAYSAHHEPDPPPPTNPAPSGAKGGPEAVKERALAVLKVWTFLLGSNSIFFWGSQMFLWTPSIWI